MNAPPDAFDFDLWRERYDSMTYEDHLDTYSELWRLYPLQQHFDARSCDEFIRAVKPAKVLEIGGWNGEMAGLMLGQHADIAEWWNVEICQEARTSVAASVGAEKHNDTHPAGRYFATHPQEAFIWDRLALVDADVLVMSHSAEHMRWMQLRAILERSQPTVRAIYLAMPLPMDGSAPDWRGYPGTHILEVGWDSISAFLGGLGFRQMEAPRTHEVRAWARPISG